MARSRRTKPKPSQPSAIFARRLQEVRRRRPMSQADLAAAVNRIGGPGSGWHQTTIARVEAGKRRVDVDEVFMLAAALEVSPLWLFVPDPKDAVLIGKSWEFDSRAFVRWVQGDEALPDMDATEFQIAKLRTMGIQTEVVKPRGSAGGRKR